MIMDDIERIYVPSLGLHYDQCRYEFGQLRSRYDMAIEALAFFESKRILDAGVIKEVSREHKVIMAEMKLELMKSKNWVSVPELFAFSRFHGEGEMVSVVNDIPHFFRIWDWEQFTKMTSVSLPFNWYLTNIFKHSHDDRYPGIPWVETKTVSLKVLCMRSLSYYNRVFTGDRYGRYTVQSCENLYPNKIVDLIAKFDKPTRVMKNPTPMISKLLFLGLRRMYNYMGVEQFFGKLVWEFNDRDVLTMEFPKQSSAGIRAGKSRTHIDHGVKVRVTPNGTKGDQTVPCKKRMMEYIREYRRTKKITFLEKACTICMKVEIFNTDSIDPEKRRATYNKCREFFIPHMMQYFIALLTVKDRQMFERGRQIKVGLRWWHGGAEYFAKQMKYDDPTMVFSDGDFDALDTTIHRVLLELYETQASIYYKTGTPDYPLFMILLQQATSNLSVKLVHVFSKVWKLMLGVMPSGAYETSHGNSWIVGLLFWTYFEQTIFKFPHRAAQLEKTYRDRRIEFPVYGDDHVPAIGREVIDIFNETGYADFVATVFDMKIHKIRENVPFLSIPDEFGGLKEDGVIFLKRRFIKKPKDFPKECANILPYKTMKDALVKFAYGNNERLTYADYTVACLGLAYDNMGVNPVIHQFCEQLFRFTVHVGKFRDMDQIRDAFFEFNFCEDRRLDITRIMRKVGLNTDELWKGFPTRQRLIDMHTYDAEYVDFTPPFKRYSNSECKAWEDGRLF